MKMFPKLEPFKAAEVSEDGELAHSERGPSTAHRWRPCPGSVRMSRGLKDEAGIEAAYGTVFHEIAAICLEQRLDPQGFVGDGFVVGNHGHVVFDQAMADHMRAGLKVLWAFADEPEAVMIVEKRVSLENWVGKGEFGTTDCAIIIPHLWRIVIWDWKYGAGVPVHPEMNDQAMLYLLGTWDDYARGIFQDMHDIAGADMEPGWEDSVEVNVIIEQPRAPGGGGTWTTTMGAVLREGQRIKIDARRTEDPDAPVVPGPKQCKFCKAAKFNVCEPRARMLLEEAGADYDELDTDLMIGAPLEIRPVLSPEKRSQVLLHKAQIIAYLDQLSEEAHKDALMGRPVPGMKLVEGHWPNRKWKDPVRAEAVLRKLAGPKAFVPGKLLSPPQAQELLKNKIYEVELKALVDQGDPAKILVPDYDRRAAIPNMLSDYDDDDAALV